MKKSISIIATILSLTSYASTDEFVKFGDVIQIASPIIAAGVSLNRGDSEGFTQLALSHGLNQGLTHIMKSTIDAKRPNGGPGSFPSGHTSSSFGGATFLHYKYGFKVASPLYFAATLAGVSRIDGKYHHVHDVAAGALLATFSSYVFTDPKVKVNLSPILSRDGKSKGLMFGISF